MPAAPDGGAQYLGVGLADALITRLSAGGEINVRPIEAIRRYSTAGQDPLAAGRELGVDAVVDGTIQRTGDRFWVNVRLLRVAGGGSLWADQVDARFADIFSVEDTITRRVAVALLPQLAGQRASSRPPTSDVEAYEDYLKGRFFWSRRSADGLRTAIAWFQKAIDRDPKFAAAYAGMADSYALLGFYSMLPPSESYPNAQAAALKAIALDDMLAEAHASLLSVMTDYNWNSPAAEREFRRTIELNPNYAPAHQWYAYLLVASNHPEQAQAEM